MKREKNLAIPRRLSSLLLSLLLLLTAVVPASAVNAKTPTRAIAIVFDNSGSMYSGANAAAWCRATYAIEVFASMMNDGDTLSVFPMYEVEVEGKSYNDSNPVVLTNQNSSSIRTMYTPEALDTPLEAIDRAFEGVSASSADEKWLIVLTDGAEFYENGVGLGEGEPTKAALTSRLTKYNDKVNVMYLGMGSVAAQPEINGRLQHYTAAAKDTARVLDELTNMCNSIFGRDILKTSGNNISFDIPMSKLIVFVQGDNISNVQVKDASGKPVGETVSSLHPEYAKKGAGNYSGTVDTSLQGAIITYADCEKGDYKLTYDGSMSSISVYYEPDVDLAVTLRNPEGDAISPDAAYEGAYTVEYHMVDKYGEPTDSKLLGSMDYAFDYNISGVDYSYNANSAGEFTLEKELIAGDSLQFSADVKYLSGYEIHKSHDELLPGFSNPISIIADNNRFKLKLDAEQDYYQMSKISSAKPMVVTASLEGSPLSAKDMEKAELYVTIKDTKGTILDPSKYEVTKLADQSSWNIALKKDSDIASGKYTVDATAKTLNHSNEEVTAHDTEKITVSAYPEWMIPAAIALAILLLLLLLWLYLNAKVLPKNATFINTKFVVDGDPISGLATVRFNGGGKRRGTVTITSPRVSGSSTAKCSIKMDVEAVSPRRTKSARRAMTVTNIAVSPGNGNVQSVMAGPAQFKWSPADKKYMKIGGKPNAPIAFKVGNMARYSITGQTITGTSISMSGQLKHH